MDIPVFHDDQHGTAIIAAAGLINACHLTGRDLRDTKLVVNGAGAAGDRLRRAAEGDGHAAGATSCCATPRASSTRAAPTA